MSGTRASPARAFWTVAVPLARPGFLTGAVLGFAHTVGEFGVVLMIGGNIPNQTRVLSIAIFNDVERQNWGEAHILALGLVVFGLVGAQMGWVLRPFIGNPNIPFTWFRGRQSNFFEAVLHTLGNLFS